MVESMHNIRYRGVRYRPHWPRRLEISDAKKRRELIHDSETSEPLELGPERFERLF